MGKVFSPLEIQSGYIPEPGAHVAAAGHIIDALLLDNNAPIFNGNGVHSGMIYGSTAMGSANLRSDVDVLLNFHEDEAHEALPLIRRVFRDTEQTYKVPIESNILPVGATMSLLEHAIDPLFAQHLLEIQYQDEPRWSYGWPVNGLNIDTTVLTEDAYRKLAIRYCSTKLRQFARGLVDYDGEPDYKHMQRALELPAAIGRKVLAVVHGPDHVTQAVLQDKTDATKQVADVFDSINRKGWRKEDSKQRFLELAKMDATYNDVLRGAISGDISLSEYSKYLTSSYEATLLLGITVAQSWVNILNWNLDKRNLELETADHDRLITTERQEFIAAGLDPDTMYDIY